MGTLELIELVAIAAAGPLLLGLGWKTRHRQVGRGLLILTSLLGTATCAVQIMRSLALEKVGSPEFHVFRTTEEGRHTLSLNPSWEDELHRAGVVLEKREGEKRTFSSADLRKAKFQLNGRELPPGNPTEVKQDRHPLVESVQITGPLILEYVVTKESRSMLEACQIRVHPAGVLKGFRQGQSGKIGVYRIGAGVAFLWCILGVGILWHAARMASARPDA